MCEPYLGALLDAVAGLRAQNGATPVEAAWRLIEALNYADADAQVAAAPPPVAEPGTIGFMIGGWGIALDRSH